MSNLPNNIIASFTQIQTEIWHKVGAIFSEAAGDAFNFVNPVTSAIKPSELKGETGVPMLTIQCSFNGMPENPQVIALSGDAILSLVEHLSGERPDEVDDAAVAGVRPLMDAIVQGLCTAVGQFRGETLVASDLTVRYQVFVIPPNLQKGPEIAKVQVGISAGEFDGSLFWLTDSETIHFILNETIEEEDDQSSVTIPFPQVSEQSHPMAPAPSAPESPTIDRLLDIPLEVSVELGRVRMLVKDIVDLGTGSIVEIDKAAGEPVDVLVNGRLVARGEVVVIEDNFGVRITEILNPYDRLNRLSEVA
jgi:flagellar motor switch protein FliN/FliY